MAIAPDVHYSYRGYLIKWLPDQAGYEINYGIHHVRYVNTIAEGKKLIDELTSGDPSERAPVVPFPYDADAPPPAPQDDVHLYRGYLRVMPFTPPGPHWSQREYVACMQMGIGFAAHRRGDLHQTFHYHFPDNIGDTSVLIDHGDALPRYIDHGPLRSLTECMSRGNAAAKDF